MSPTDLHTRNPIRRLVHIGRFSCRLVCILIGVAAAGCLVIMASGSATMIHLALLITLIAGVIAWRRVWLPVGTLILVTAVLGWFMLRTPSNERDWLEEVSVLPEILVDGDDLTIKGFRNFRRFKDGSYEAAWEERTFDLTTLQGIELMVQPLGEFDAVAHTMLGFNFGDDGRFILSIEARKEKGETYGPIAGGLRQFELIYLFIDERDSLTSRAFSGAKLYCYPARSKPTTLRTFLVTMCKAANNLHDQPRFYRIIRDNCTTEWLKHLANSLDGPRTFDPMIILNGRIGQLLFERGNMATDLPYESAKVVFRIDERVRKYADTKEFSARIRQADADAPYGHN